MMRRTGLLWHVEQWTRPDRLHGVQPVLALVVGGVIAGAIAAFLVGSATMILQIGATGVISAVPASWLCTHWRKRAMRVVARERQMRLVAEELALHRSQRDETTGFLDKNSFIGLADKTLAAHRHDQWWGYLILVQFNGSVDVASKHGVPRLSRDASSVIGSIRDCVRANDLVGRLGGHRLAILIVAADRSIGKRVVDRIETSVGGSFFGSSGSLYVNIVHSYAATRDAKVDDLIATASSELPNPDQISLKAHLYDAALA